MKLNIKMREDLNENDLDWNDFESFQEEPVFKEKQSFEEMGVVCTSASLRVEIRSKEAGYEPHFCVIVGKNHEVNISILRAEYVHPNNPKYRLSTKEKKLLNNLLKEKFSGTPSTNFQQIYATWNIINFNYRITKTITQPDYTKLP